MECYSGGNVVGAIFGTIFVIVLLAVLAWWMYMKSYCKLRKDSKLVSDDDPENAKHEFAFDNPAFKGDGNKSSLLNTNWTSPKQPTANDKRKPLDDSYAGTPAPRLVSLKGSDFTGLGIECYGGLKDGIYVKKVAPQGPASGHINIGDRITSLTIDFQHIVQEDAMTILSYASPYNVQLELVSNNKLRASGSSKGEPTSPKPGRQSPLVHPLARSSSQSDLNTIERNSRKKLFNNDSQDYPTLKMDKTAEANATSMIEAHTENEKKSPSLMQQFRNQIAKIEEKFQNRSTDKSKMQNDAMMVEAGSTSASPEPAEQADKSKKGMKFGIRVFPPNVNEKLFGKSRSKSPSPDKTEAEKKDEMKMNMNMDVPDGAKTTQVTIECENFNRQNSINSSGIKRDANGIPQELPAFMANAANAARDGRKMGNDSGSRKSKAKAPRPPMSNVDLDASTDTMDTNLNMTDSSVMTANNTNNANIEIEDELDRITEKYLNQSKDKMNFSDNFANSSMLNKTGDSVTLFDKIEDLKDEIDDVILRRKEPSNSSTPKSERKESPNKSFGLDESDLDLSNYGNRMELNSSDVTVHQPNEAEDVCDETRRAASLGDLSLMMKKSLTEKDGNSMERAQSLDITADGGNGMIAKQSLALALSRPTADLSVINGGSEDGEMPTIYQMEAKSPKTEVTNGMNGNYDNDTNVPDDVKVIRYPFGSMERPKSDVLKKILGTPTMQKFEIEQETTVTKSSTAPSIVFMTPATNGEATETVPMTNGIMKSIVTIENEKPTSEPMKVLSIDTTEVPVSLTLVNNSFEKSDPNQMSPIFSSNNKGINSIKISTTDFKPVTVSSTIIKNSPENHYTENYFVKDNVVTISTDSQPSSIQFIDDVKLDFNMQVLDDLEKDEPKSDFKPKIIEAEVKVDKEVEMNGKVNGNASDSEINNNVSKTTIISSSSSSGDDTQEMLSSQQMSKFLTEIVFKGDDSAIEDMTASEETATLTSSTMSNASSESTSPNVMTSTKTMTLTNVPLSTANFLKQERRHVEKNFVPHNNEIKFTTSVYENSSSALNNHQHQREPQKRMSQIEQIRQNFEKSAQASMEIPAPIPVARRSSIPLSIQKTSPSKIPVFSKQGAKTSPKSRTNSVSRLTSSTDSVG